MNNNNNDQVLLPHLSQSTQNVSAESSNTLHASSTQGFNTDFAASVADSRATDLSGPQFSETKAKTKIEKEKTGGWGAKFSDTFKNNKSTILAFGIILASIVGGVMLAGTLSTGTDSLETNLTAVTNTASISETAPLANSNTLAVTGESATGEFTQTASFGEGVTHLARKAVAGYIAASSTELSAEQKIYAEDYLKDIQGSVLLEEGDAVTFTASEIQEAVNESLLLEEWQIENLAQYTQNVQL